MRRPRCVLCHAERAREDRNACQRRVAEKQVVMQAAEGFEKQVAALGAHLASVPDPDKSEEDFRKYMRAKGTSRGLCCNEEEALPGADQG